MAQAARLNLRMQKELKLLLSDPPPGAAFPSLSSDSDTSLSSIDAQIEGPEGSVYEKGVFKLKVQIPERYPFQPPIVTFVTPIYHPNIDTGGRICLDILNLPPKGAWQPSLNISTVLTSIGLLLTEPNPDDGLMQEASKEYKYNRQVFDQKARSMTEKYAGVEASKIENVAQSSQSLPNPSIHSAEAKGSDTSIASVQDHFVSHKRLCGVTRKLSLESPESHQNTNDAKVMNEVPTRHLNDRQSKVMVLEQESNATISEHNKAHKDLEGTRKKLSLQKKNDDAMSNVMPTSSLSQPQILLMDTSKSRPLAQPGSSSQPNPSMDKDDQPTSNCTGTRLKSYSQKSLASRQGIGEDDKKRSFALQETPVQFSSSGSHRSPPLAQTISCDNEREPHKDVADGHVSSFSKIKHKKLGLSGRRLSREQIGWNHCPQKDYKENVPPKSSLPLSHIQKNPKSSSAGTKTGGFYKSVEMCTNSSHNLSGTEQRKNPISLVECNDMKMVELQLKRQSEYLSGPRNLLDNNSYNDKDDGERFSEGLKIQEEASLSADAVVVLDSEDSEEEDRTTRSKLSLVRRRLPGKRKFNT